MLAENIRMRLFSILLGTVLISPSLQAYYNVGDQISQTTRDRVIQYCANNSLNMPLGQLLLAGEGEPTRVLLINFFASW